MDSTIKWEWGYFGKCYVNGKFSHSVRLQELHDGKFRGQYFKECCGPGGLMLGVLKESKNLDEAVEQAEKESLRIKSNGVESLPELKKKLKEYPYGK